jgi:hypothetical protein
MLGHAGCPRESDINRIKREIRPLTLRPADMRVVHEAANTLRGLNHLVLFPRRIAVLQLRGPCPLGGERRKRFAQSLAASPAHSLAW